MALLDTRKAQSREKRRGALSHYHGTLSSLLSELSGAAGDDSSLCSPFRQRVRTFGQSTPGEALAALLAISGMRDAAIVVHGAAGCAAASRFLSGPGGVPWYSSGLNEGDTILGGEEKLRAALQKACAGGPSQKIVFVAGTPINAINNDDVEAVLLELEEEFAGAILFIYIEVNGFKTKCSATGFDVVYHAFLKKLKQLKKLKEETPEAPLLNLLSASESPENLASIEKIFLQELEIPHDALNILPRYAGWEEIKNAGASRGSISLNDGENEYFMTGLQELYGIEPLWTRAPIGTAASAAFFRKAAAVFGKESLAERLAQRGAEAASVWTRRRPFDGGRVFLDTGVSQAPGLIALTEELGGKVSGLLLPWLDSFTLSEDLLEKLKKLPGETPVIIGEGHQFELANALGKNQADFFIGSAANAPAAAGAGARPVVTDRLVYYGWAGVEGLAKKALLAKENDRYGAFLREYHRDFYAPAALERRGNWYVKVEVS